MNYRKIWEEAYGPIPKDKEGRSYEIHHIDGNRENNSLKNLICLSVQEHYKLHFKQGDEAACHAIRLRMKGYNLTGWHHSEETKQKMRKPRLKRECTYCAKKVGNLFRHELTCKVNPSRKTLSLSKEHRQKISQALKGHKHSEDTKRKISKAHKGKEISDQHKQKLREFNLGRKRLKKVA